MSVHSNQEEEENACKKGDDDSQESAKVMVKKSIDKRPVLIVDVLNEIVPCILLTGDRENGRIQLNTEGLQRFMLSGKAPFNAGLRYFSRLSSIDHVEVNADGLEICEFSSIGTGDHNFSYDFHRLNDIIAVIGFDWLVIKSYPKSDAGKRTLALLLHKEIKNVEFISFYQNVLQLPNDYISFFKKECTFDEIRYFHDPCSKPSVSDIFMMNSAEHCIYATFELFVNDLVFIEGNTFPDVRFIYLNTEPGLIIGYDGAYSDWTKSLKFGFKLDNVISLMSHISKCFPNLKKLHILCYQVCDNWFEAFETMLCYHPEMFKSIPSQIKGSIQFEIIEECTDFSDVMEKVGHNVGIDFWHNGDDLYKEFEIHDGLKFSFNIYFEKADYDNDEALINESEDDGEDVA